MIEHLDQPSDSLNTPSRRDHQNLQEELNRVVRILQATVERTGQSRDSGSGRVSSAKGRAALARKDLLLRSIEALTREIDHLDPGLVEKLLKSSDPRLLVGLAKASLEDSPIDREDRMTLKGAERLQKMLDNAGGTVSTSWVSRLLGTNEEAVRKRAQRRALIGRRAPSGELCFPRFQFDEDSGKLLPGLSRLLSQTASWSPEELIRFLLVRHNPESSDDTPLKMLQRGEIDRVLDLAAGYLKQRP